MWKSVVERLWRFRPSKRTVLWSTAFLGATGLGYVAVTKSYRSQTPRSADPLASAAMPGNLTAGAPSSLLSGGTSAANDPFSGLRSADPGGSNSIANRGSGSTANRLSMRSAGSDTAAPRELSAASTASALPLSSAAGSGTALASDESPSARPRVASDRYAASTPGRGADRYGSPGSGATASDDPYAVRPAAAMMPEAGADRYGSASAGDATAGDATVGDQPAAGANPAAPLGSPMNPAAPGPRYLDQNGPPATQPGAFPPTASDQGLPPAGASAAPLGTDNLRNPLRTAPADPTSGGLGAGGLTGNASGMAASPLGAGAALGTAAGLSGAAAALAGAGEAGQGRPGAKTLEGVQAPSLSIQKAAPAEIQIGKPAMFEVRVRNVGQFPAQDVVVLDQVPQGTRLMSTDPPAERDTAGNLVWGVGALAPGEEKVVRMELMPTEEGEIGSVATVQFAAQSSVRSFSTRPDLQLEVTAPREVLIGENLSLHIKISNPGTGPATGIVLTEIVPESFTHPGGAELEYDVGTLRPKEVRELDLVITAAKAGVVNNLLSAQGDGSLRAQQHTPLHVVAPSLEVGLQGPKRRFLEREATYSVFVSNPGTAMARDVELLTYLPKGWEFVKADNYGTFDPQSRAIRWSLEELPAKETGTVSLTVMPMEAGEHRLTIESKAARGLSARQEQEILVEGVAAILFQLVDVQDPVEVNGETTYEVRVVNQGSKAATDVHLEALLPAGMKALSAEGPVRYQVEQGRVVFEPLPRLAPKADTTYRIKVQCLQPGDLRLQVRVMTQELQTPVTKEESTRVFSDE